MGAFEKAPPDVQEILTKPIKELGLKLEGSPLERFVQKLYRELERKGLKKFRPLCYLTDEWGCPSGEPVIGIPFYLADPKLARLEKEMNDLEDEREILMYLRHEAGHAFNYAYELYKTPEWRDLFGPFRRPYRDDYRPVPFSRQFVRHIAGWYAQKHPDEDFAETFAVWLTPRSNWRKRYKGWGAIAKLRYVDRMARKFRDVEPVRPQGRDRRDRRGDGDDGRGLLQGMALEEQAVRRASAGHGPRRHLQGLAPPQEKGVRPAADLLSENRKTIVDKVAYWTGVRRPIVKKLVESIGSRAEELGLSTDVRAEKGPPDRGHGLRDRAGDELPDAGKVRAAVRSPDRRTLRGPRSRSCMTPGAKRGPARGGSGAEAFAQETQKEEEGEARPRGDLRSPGEARARALLPGARRPDSIAGRGARMRRGPDLQPDRVLRRATTRWT